MGFWTKFGHAISPYYNLIIFAFAVVTVMIAVSIHQNRQSVDSEIYDWEASSDDLYNVDKVDRIFDSYRKINTRYTLFITLISIFPLLGMLGTVLSLLGLDMSTAEAISNAKNNFFGALTSTAWGIIFAIIFKIVNANFFADVEDLIQRQLTLIKKLRKSGISESQKQVRL
ncbi:MotA/TolQ/ExbB proton channel family protein [Ruminococcus sp.]|uniref:MotA/TolQ/ExbB proton channel family protein n=1 Tax=Ruminococcus sp. TaxID=41978 RepID=UPI001B483467|nr:MotA/TolQ/ExbB proton channel family protein [Ruminococcus sp.]MBP5431002.1 MotA/TolQ/ExbB proton channel family protein [Ruminococcus sp.]